MEEEIEILQSIYFDDILSVDLNNEKPNLQILLYPTNTENEEDNKKTIILTLIVNFTSKYPNEVPQFNFKNVKGIIEEDINKIHENIKEIADRNIGNQMLFEIIQFIKDFLTTYENVPKSCKCSICLTDFDISSKVSHLDCYHYFHSSCLTTHMIYMIKDIEKEKLEAANNKILWKSRTVVCPVCREPMKDRQIEELKKYSWKYSFDFNDDLNKDNIIISDKMRNLQTKMKCLFEKQKQAGGIIEKKEDEIIVLSRSDQSEQSVE